MTRELIDIHTHIIPGVDDGSRSEHESTEMLVRYRELGFDTVIATPHSSVTYLPDTDDGLLLGYQQTQSLASSHNVTLLNGKEVRLTPYIRASQSELATFGLAGTRNVLVDFPSGSWPYYAEDALFQLQARGFIPILAHPERYGWGPKERSIPRELFNRGILLQVTLGSLAGAFGSKSRAISVELINSGLVHFTATDAHNPGGRMEAASEGINWLRKKHGDHGVFVTLRDNPQAMLNGDRVEAFAPTRKRFKLGGIDFSRLLPPYK